MVGIDKKLFGHFAHIYGNNIAVHTCVKQAVKERDTSMSKTRTGRILSDGFFYVIGSALYALSVVIFISPNNISPGGLTGVATLVNYLTPIPIGTAMLAMNIPLMLAGWKRLGIDFTIRTAVATVLVSAMIDLFELFVPAFYGDIILTSVFGGVMSGAGLGLIYMRGGTTGGSEIIARLAGLRYTHIPIGRLILIVDAVVVAAAAVVYRNIQGSLYAIILIYVSAAVMDTMIYGKNKGKMLLIISKHEERISSEIMEKMQRGVTKLCGVGGYSGQKIQMILCAVRPSEVYQIRTLVYDIDKDAFIIVVSTDEVLGEGFGDFVK
jgi:uncharacterized membrane-anchored protein YitT (DUF2179 family)